MAYVGAPFEYDLFISYSHGDDGKGNGILQPWSAAFAAALENELRADRRIRQALKVFLDSNERPGEGVDPMAGLTPQLEKHIGGSAVLVVLMSPDYLASQWCAREREWWCRRQAELGMPTDERIAVVHIWPTSEPWPADLCDPQGEPLVGFAFHDDSAGAARPLGWTDPAGEFGREFKVALVGIAGRVSTRLVALKAQAEALAKAHQEAAKLQQQGGQSIYLHGRVAQKKAWERAAIALADKGYAVLPGEPDPAVTDPQASLELRERRVDALGACDALLLLGTDDGRTLDIDMVAVGRHDRHSARARSNRLLPCGVLDTVGAPIATMVRKATARNLQAEWLDGTKDPWIPGVQKWLAAKGAEAEGQL